MEFKEYLPQKRCGCCHLPIKVCRNRPDEFICYDNKFYHVSCFTEEYTFRRKCSYCKEPVWLHEGNPEHNVCYNNKYYHYSCFHEWCKATKNPSKIRLNALKNIDCHVNTATEQIRILYKEKNKKMLSQIKDESIRVIQSKFCESDTLSFIKEFYGIQTVPGVVWKRIESVYKGTYKNLDVPIPQEHLYEMWRTKQNYLRKANVKLESKNNVTTEGIILYDLAILMNKYNDYLSWKNKQNVLQSEIEVDKEEIQLVSQLNLGQAKQAKQTENNNTEDDITGLIDDIFGE